MMKAEPQKEHQWLHKLVGEWTSEGEASMGPGKPTEKFKSTERVRSLGGLWVLGESTGDMPGGGTATMLMTLGYDPQKKRFVGTWIGSMMTYLWVYDGSLDASRKDPDAQRRRSEHGERRQDSEVSRRHRVQERRPPRADVPRAG